MSDQSSQEPTMEEILASIRRIISEDDGPVADAVPEEEEPAPAAAAEPELPPIPEDEDDGVLELTDKVETLGDLDVYTPAPAAEAEPEPEPEPETAWAPDPEPEPAPVASGEGLVGDPAAALAAAAFGSLSSSILMPREGRTLEDVVRELLRPLMKQWLDENLPRITEDVVRAEVERISRGGRVG